jgi:hypothetical protein
MTTPASWAKVTENQNRKARSANRAKGLTEKGIEDAIVEAFRFQHRVALCKTDAGGQGVKGLLANPPRWLLEALGIPAALPWGLIPALLVPPGFPDRAGLLPDGRWLFIEVKKPGGTFREGQKAFLEAARAAGHIAFHARSVDEALEKFREQMGTVAA